MYLSTIQKLFCVPQDRYVCAVTKDTLGNSVPCAVLRSSWVWLSNCLFSKNWSDFIHFHTFRPCPHFSFSLFLFPLSLKWSRSHYGVCGEAHTERHDWSSDWRQTERKGHHTPSEGVYERHNAIKSVSMFYRCTVSVMSVFARRQGGTGFAGSGVDLKAKEARPVMQA